MSDNEHNHDHAEPDGHHINYVKIWVWLLILLVISLIGPEIGIKWITLLTAFGIAFVKAAMVCGWFMHLATEKKIAWYMMLGCLALMLVLFAGLAPDIMEKEGSNWEHHPYEPDLSRYEHHDDAHGDDDDHGDHHDDGDHDDHDGHDHDGHDH
jgi:caa(3)-type oxidase subunit IV